MLSIGLVLFFYMLFTVSAYISVYIGMQSKKTPTTKIIVGLGISTSLCTISLALNQMLQAYRLASGVTYVETLIWFSGLSILAFLGTLLLIPRKRAELRWLINHPESQDKYTLVQKTTTEHMLFYKHISVVYGLGALLNLFHYFYYEVSPYRTLFISLLVTGLSLVLYMIPLTCRTKQFELFLLTGVVSVSIPLVQFVFLMQYGSNIVWPIPFLFLMVPIIYSDRKMYAVIAWVSTSTFLLSWFLLPTAQVSVGKLDYFARVLIYIFAIILASYINRNYMAKLKKINHLFHFNKVISKVSSSFIKATESRLDEIACDMLQTVGECINADRGYIGRLSSDGQYMELRNEWLKENKPSVKEELNKWDLNTLEWLGKEIKKKEAVIIKPGNRLTDTGVSNISSFLYLPIVNKEKIIGFIAFDQLKPRGKWNIYEHELLKILPGLYSDALSKIESDENLSQLAYRDTLTGLPNRAYLYKYLQETVQEAESSGQKFHIIFLDLDGFKAINDSLGHNWGDDMLCRVSERLSSVIRNHDLLARFGGDEFIIITSDTEQDHVTMDVIERIFQVFHKPFRIGNQDFYTTVSAGVVNYPDHGKEATTLIKHADIAMYKAKDRGKNRYEFFSYELIAQGLSEIRITNSLYTALEKKELYLVYQPQVCLQTGMIKGFEALIRWNHPEYGFVPPSQFIPIAEKTGLIHDIGEWIIREACRQNKCFQDLGHPPVTMAVNLSILQFSDVRLKGVVADALSSSGLKAKYLELEITEGIAMKESIDVVECLHSLKELGISVSIDDFGTEYSSMKRLKKLPVDCLKIDIKFIRGIGLNPSDEGIINFMVYLAKSLGLKVIAEGVETKAQCDFLIQQGCEEVQGYYFYKPLSVRDIEGMYTNKEGLTGQLLANPI